MTKNISSNQTKFKGKRQKKISSNQLFSVL